MKTDAAKSAIFASIRQNLAASRPFDAAHAVHHGSPATDFAPAVSKEFSKETLIETFRQNLEFVGGNFSRVTDERAAAGVLDSILGAKNARRTAFSDSPLVKRIVGLSESDADFIENAPAAVLFETDLGVTGAQWAIAETGTLVLEAESERHRLVSLVPPIHVCVLEADRIRQTLSAILEILQKDLSRTVTFVTGASRTSDIELTLAIGVHGPGELHVIVIDGEG
jgi:L-lactate dehydrogenase complex protein LldG